MRRILTYIIVAGLWLLCSAPAVAQSPWSTSFDCPEWTQANGLGEAQVCLAGDNIQGHGGWTTGLGKADQITTAANNPLGTGRGFRHWRGGANTTDNTIGANSNGGGRSLIVILGEESIHYERHDSTRNSRCATK